MECHEEGVGFRNSANPLWLGSKLAHSIHQANQERTETDGREVDVDPVDLIFARARQP
jgi:hypothetical protein